MFWCFSQPRSPRLVGPMSDNNFRQLTLFYPSDKRNLGLLPPRQRLPKTKALMVAKQAVRFLADCVLPDNCVLCHLPQPMHQWHEPLRFEDHLCPYCRGAIALNANPCECCALPLPPGQTVCGRCTTAPLADLALAPVLHQHCGAYLINRLKFHNGAREANTLCGFMLATIQQRYSNTTQLPDYLLPVPIASLAMLRRGYNQSHWLAKPLQQQLGIPILTGAFRRKNGPSQRTLTRSERMRLPATTFTATAKRAFKPPRSRPHIAIVDDVLTTGSTVSVLAKTLRQAGAGRVDVWTATRA